MKKLNKKNCFVAALLFGLGFMLTVLPAQLPAQDIDDVIQGLDQDFSLGGKQEVKRSNVAAANEQNREDVQIEAKAMLDAASANANIIITYNAIINPSNITVNSVADGIITLPVGVNINVNGAGIVGPTIVTAINPGLVNTPLFVSLTCNSGTCNVSFSVSGGATCPLVTTGPFTTAQTFQTLCST